MSTRPAHSDLLGERVRAARVAKGRSLRSLAGSLGVSPATLSLIENGRTPLTDVRLREIAEALWLTETEIRAGEVAPPSRSTRASGAPSWRDWRRYGPLALDPMLQAAIDEIVDVGYHAATIRSIAERCGIAMSAIYNHYDNKQHLLMAIYELTMDETLGRGQAAQAEGDDPVGRFTLLIEHLALLHTHRRELAFIGASEMRSLTVANRRRITRLRNQMQQMIDAEVDAAVRAGDFRDDHPHDASRAVVTMCAAIPTWWHPGGALTPEEVAERHVSFALDILRPRG